MPIGIIIADPTYFFLCPVLTLKNHAIFLTQGPERFFCVRHRHLDVVSLHLHQYTKSLSAQGSDVNQSVVFNSITEDLFLGAV